VVGSKNKKFKSFRNPHENSVANLGKSQCIAMLILYLDDRDALTLLSISKALYSACFGRNWTQVKKGLDQR
jgi:hypothetical protein